MTALSGGRQRAQFGRGTIVSGRSQKFEPPIFSPDSRREVGWDDSSPGPGRPCQALQRTSWMPALTSLCISKRKIGGP